MHYGVKGMKWGIRKAIQRAPHSLAYNKVRKKLEMLSETHDRNKVEKAKIYGHDRKIKKMYNKAAEKLEKLNNNANRDYQRGQNSQMKEDQSRMFWWSDSAGNMGSSPKANAMVRIMNRVDGLKSKHLMSDKGHAKAVKKRNAYAKRMSRVFKGTKYSPLASAAARKRVRVQA